jgi:hypothetical protein
MPISPIYFIFVFNKDVVNLFFETDNCVVSPGFEKHTIGIGSKLLNNIGYVITGSHHWIVVEVIMIDIRGLCHRLVIKEVE